ncbi:zinc finger protein 316-like, partial [Lethenteron reissneri]|uniref:zinc finger protein 316-like n=1 Tax=Lethenteron reissneri TaxID=7753 RepID=UPI002AB79AB7
ADSLAPRLALCLTCEICLSLNACPLLPSAVRLEECPRDPNTPHLRGPPCHPASAQLPTVSSAAPQQQRGTSWLRHRNVPHPHHSAAPYDGQPSCAQRSAYITATATATTLSLDPTDRGGGGVAGSVGRRTRPDESPCACAVCGKVFTRARAYARHARTHTGEKPYRCEQCGKVFALSSYLKLHARTHTGEKPYRCRVCGRRFAATSNLAHHKKRHTGSGGGGGGHHARAPHATLPMMAMGPSSHGSHGSPGHGYEQ